MITAQTTQLANERNAIEIQRRRIDKSVLLIKALGGGWDSSKLPQFRPRGSYGCTPMSSKLNRRIRKFGWLQALDLRARRLSFRYGPIDRIRSNFSLKRTIFPRGFRQATDVRTVESS